MTKRLITLTLLSIALLALIGGSFTFGRAAAQEDRTTNASSQQTRVCFTDSFEPNESITQAQPIMVGLYTPLYVCAGDNDYFSIELAAGEVLAVDLAFTHNAGDLELRITNAVGTVFDSGSSTSDNESVSFRATTSDTYYIRVLGWTATVENAYEMMVDVACPDCISYQGQLQTSGSNANGDYEFEFTLYDTSSAGSQIGDSTTQTLTVADGLFSAEIYFGDPDTYAHIYPQFLNIAVRPAGSTGAFTPLSPRTELTAAPTAFTLVSGALISGTETALNLHSSSRDGLTVQFAKDDGIYIVDTDDEGIYIQNAGETGIFIDNATKAAIAAQNISDIFPAGIFVNTNQSTVSSNHSGGVGVYARGKGGTSATDPDAADLILGATSGGGGSNRTSDDGRISSDPAYSSSDLEIASMDKVWVLLDDDNNSSGAYFAVYNHSSDIGDRVFYVQDDGDVYAKSYNTITRGAGRDGEPIVQYGATAMQQRIEDFGTASLFDGTATVALADNFITVANTSNSYQVFLTPRGDCQLYLASTDASSFTVQAMGGATCSIDFDYRVVAAPQDLVELQPEDMLGDVDSSELTRDASEEVTP